MNEENDLRLAKAVLAWGRTDARVAAVGWTAELERKWDERKGETMCLARRLAQASARGGGAVGSWASREGSGFVIVLLHAMGSICIGGDIRSRRAIRLCLSTRGRSVGLFAVDPGTLRNFIASGRVRSFGDCRNIISSNLSTDIANGRKR